MCGKSPPLDAPKIPRPPKDSGVEFEAALRAHAANDDDAIVLCGIVFHYNSLLVIYIFSELFDEIR